MSACLALEQKLRIAYLGPAGTFSHAAVGKHFGQFVDALPYATIDEIFRAGEAGQADYAVVPVENSTEGAVGRTLDLMYSTELSICGEIKLRVEQNLLVEGRRRVERVRKIYSHAQSLAQCAQWLARHLAGCGASSCVEQRRGGAARRAGARHGGDRRRDRRVDLRSGCARCAHRGRAEQHDAVLGARPAERAAVRARRDVARDVRGEPARCDARAARAVCTARRFDDADRVASGADRVVGIPVLRRRARPSRRYRRRRGVGGAEFARRHF